MNKLLFAATSIVIGGVISVISYRRGFSKGADLGYTEGLKAGKVIGMLDARLDSLTLSTNEMMRKQTEAEEMLAESMARLNSMLDDATEVKSSRGPKLTVLDGDKKDKN